MARPPEFDRTHALEQAMKLFWSRGYGSTSLAQLLDAMGVARSSFYATFGDKRELFVECLALFAERTVAILDAPTVQSAPEFAPAHFFHETLFAVPRHRAQRGCMMVNAILELADVDASLSHLASQGLKRVERRFETLLAQAQTQQRFDRGVSPAALAQYLMTVNQGLRVQSRKRVSVAQLRSVTDTSLTLASLPSIANLKTLH